MIGAWLQQHRRSLLIVTVLLALGGGFAAFSLPVALFPNIQFPRIIVGVDAGDRPVDRMILEVTQPLEQALRGVPGVQDIRSTSSRGSAEISVNFAWGTDMITALVQAESAVNKLLPNLPRETKFTARRLDPTVFPVLGLALTSKTRDLVSLRDFAYYQLRREISTVSGVANVDTLGGRQEEYHVQVDPARLRALGISINSVVTALSASNVVTAVGRLEDQYRLYLLLSSTPLRGLDDIRHTILRSGSNGVVTLGDVADVRRDTVPEWTTVTANGSDAVLVNVFQQPGANTVAITQEVKAAVAAFTVPADIQIKPYYDQSKLVLASEKSVRDAIAIGAIFAAAVLFLFLWNWRVTLIIALMLPTVLAAAILLLHMLNMNLDMMTLGGMAAAVGLIVDDGVVMLEHIMRRLKQEPQLGKDLEKNSVTRRDTVLRGAMEMSRPLLGSSLATTVIFLPLAFLSGVAGGFFKALALTMASALFISFFVAFFVVPLLGEFLLAGAQPKTRKQYIMHWLEARYRVLMGGLLTRPLWALPIVALLCIAGFFAYTQVGSGFLPHMDEGGFILDYKAAPGTSLTETDRLLRQVEQIIAKVPEVDSYSRRTGLQLGGGLTEANAGDFFIHLTVRRSRGIDAIMSEVRQQVQQDVPGLQIETSQLVEDLIGDLTAVPQPIEIKIFSSDVSVLKSLPSRIAAEISKVSGVVEVKNGIVIAGDAIDIEIDRVKAALEGLDEKSITGQIQDQLGGNVTSQIQSKEKIIGVRIWTPQRLRERISLLQNTLLQAPDGHYLPLKRVAQIKIAVGQPQITRENSRQMVAVTARIVGRDLGSTVQDVKTALGKLQLPGGVQLKYGGLYKEQQKSSHDLLIVFVAAVLLVSVLLLFLYERLTVVISILATTLLTLTGVFVGLWLTGTERNISAMMGMTMIVGMVTEIAIFYFDELDVATRPGPEALIDAGVGRMRAILMSAIIAILALSPLALGLGAGSGMLKPLAIAIIAGLIVAVPLVLLLMPALYASMNRLLERD
ncbi:CzcA family heavy metal efflux pump [Paraburkholderia sp. UCT70]|uniref:efflux RND transporter permease subunit n=1 Tax=Paraburkholderia sp. UCT70 TaxID=2991068 RepID=UPI003D1BB764